jgi:hypothetical protein
LVAVEIADRTLKKDLEIKLPIYAKVGIVELWVEDLKHDQILVSEIQRANDMRRSRLFTEERLFTSWLTPISKLTPNKLLG